jgi:hypothetical protein
LNIIVGIIKIAYKRQKNIFLHKSLHKKEHQNTLLYFYTTRKGVRTQYYIYTSFYTPDENIENYIISIQDSTQSYENTIKRTLGV